jgi:DNA topoisomerase I
MKKILVIVESPGKIKSVQSYLGDKYNVMASVGHIIDLPANHMSVDIDNNFKPTYKPINGKNKVINLLHTNLANSSDILIATDKDREGEMIAWSIAHVLKLKDPKRLSFNSITKKELLDAIKSPKRIDQNLVNAQKARRILDRILGYLLSPILWKNIQPKISAGRVQSVVTRLIVDKEEDIDNYIKNDLYSYFKFTGNFLLKKETYKSSLFEITKMDSKKTYVEPAKLLSIDYANEFAKKCSDSVFKVHDILCTKSKRNPGKPFTTSTLQQEASRKFGFPVKKTMMSAQILYEAGLITYMRTDSVHLSDDALNNIEKYIKKKFGGEYYQKRLYKGKKGNTQEAHEAVRPTKIPVEYINSGYNNNNKIGYNEVKLYSLIWKRTVASQMKTAEFDITTLQISISKAKPFLFQTIFQNLKFLGYMKVYNIQENQDQDDCADKQIKLPKIGSQLSLKDFIGIQEYSRPPTRYNEASLVAKLDPDNLNIGRPATYASIISKIQDNNYVVIKDLDGIEKKISVIEWNNKTKKIKTSKKSIFVNKDKNKLVPTMLGKIVTKYLKERFENIMDYKFTAQMEDNLDKVANGKEKWTVVLKHFYDKFYPKIAKIKLEKPLINNKYEKILGKYPDLDENIIATVGKFGPYIKLETTKYKVAPIKKPLTLDNITLAKAIKLLEYPKIIGKINKAVVYIKTGSIGYYAEVSGKRISVKNPKVTVDEVEKLLKTPSKNVLKQFVDGSKLYRIMNGKFGRFVNVSDIKNKRYKVNASVSEKENLDKLTLPQLKTIINDYFEKKKVKKDSKKK